ncbi:non-ribosomal peptide synthetase [Streptomyces acidiscabies]|uniref:non-ribosomal peptide synthetase n=1 Tax=Streptomyces acidiscabies TaxID=42234 RepID=UPI0009A12D20|nr:amino acid adenylation domain-containing protein [Streptomyces acidiscabies]
MSLAQRCHALRIPSPPAGTDAWTDDVPVPSTHPLAAHRRATELARPAERPRRVLLRYSDGLSDLITVAPRHGLTALLQPSAGEPALLGPAPADVQAPPAWGLADPAATPTPVTVPLDHPGDEPSWLTALSLTLRRYDSATEPVIGTDRGAVTVPTGESKPVEAQGPVLAGLLFTDAEFPQGAEYVPCLAPPFPLTFSVFRAPDGRWRLRVDHLAEHVSPGIAAQFVRHLAHVHRQILAQRPWGDVELLDAEERDRVVALGRPRRTVTGRPASLPEAFARIVAAAPDRAAVSDGGRTLTYRQLDSLAEKLARGLVARGVAPGDRVGVCLERTAELVVTLLAVVKAGAAYVPLDPAYPAERIANTAEDAGMSLVVTRGAEFLAVDRCTPDEAGTGPLPEVSADDPAYVIYTSGSTGRPKGVVVPHRNVTALVDATRDEYGLGAQDVWTWFHSAAFDFSVWEIWGCLLTGGRLVVVPYFVSREPDAFRDLLVAEKVSVLSQTPSAFGQLMSVEHAAVDVRLVVFGGEPLDARGVLPWLDRHHACRLVNMFGITETTVHVTEQTLTRALALAGTRSVGTALPGWHLYVTGPDGELLPPGVAGEICVGGAGVALGYLGQEALTAERFVPDPHTGGRLYRSGDLGRLRPDGRLEHLGRIDSQVKIRGFRIELDEIRNVLLEDPDVRTAAVVVHGDGSAARIDAYVVLAGLADGNARAVRERAANLLPDHMLPATVTALETLPLTPNGKLDQAALPAPHPASPTPPTPSTDTLADRLRAIWTDVLGTPVGLDDDFFELGGNSLSAVRITAALRAAGLPAPRLRDLYRHPTVRATAASLETAARA